MCEHGSPCNFQSATTSSVSQTLDELEFERGIWQAAIDNDSKRVKMLIDKGTSPNDRDKYGYTALHYACRAGNLEVVKLLLENDADPNAKTASGQDCPLHRAAYQGHDTIVSLLLKKGANPLMKNADGQTALHKSTQMKMNSVTKILLEATPGLKCVEDNHGNVAL